MANLIISPRSDKSVTMTIRVDKVLQERYSMLSKKTNISRNELIGMALQYALDNMKIEEPEEHASPILSELE